MDLVDGVPEWGKGALGPKGPGTRAAVSTAASRGRLKTAELVPGGPDVSAPLAPAPVLDSAPVPLRAALLRYGSRSPWARTPAPVASPSQQWGPRTETAAPQPWPVLRLWSWRLPSSSARRRPRLPQVSARGPSELIPRAGDGSSRVCGVRDARSYAPSVCDRYVRSLCAS